jgi:hypothetical protein
VDRDFHLIGQSDIVIVYYPVKDLAAGVICEMMYAKKHVQKQVYAFHPHPYSPFFEAMCADDFTGDVKIFKSAIAFSRFLRQLS